MQKIFGKAISAAVAVLLCFGVVAAGNVIPDPASAEEDYYSSVTAESGDELLGQIHDLITVTHTNYTTYADCKDPSIIKRTDPGPNGELMEFYAQAELSSKWESGVSGTWNREHVWCKSLSNGLWGESGGGSDLLHIRPTESRVNSARNNDRYGEVSGRTPIWYRDKSNAQIAVAGYSVGTVFEPIDSVKGDVARIVMYMYTHYNTYSNVHGTTNGNGNAGFFGTLRFTKVIAASDEDAAVALLLKWHEQDVVDDLERARNEAAEDIQGNRNPFVDHPEYAESIWGDAQADPPDVDPPKEPDPHALEVFREAVGEIVTEGTPAERLGSLSEAIAAYGALTDADRMSAEEDIRKLQDAIAAYNSAVAAYNAESALSDTAALQAAGSFGKGGA